MISLIPLLKIGSGVLLVYIASVFIKSNSNSDNK